MTDTPDVTMQDSSAAPAAPAAPAATQPARKSKPTGPGYSSLPASRVAKIIKSDKDITLLTKEAIFLISIAAEHFVKKLTDAAYTEARMHQRKGIQYKDLASAIQNDSIFFYLSEVLPLPITLNTALITRQKKFNRDLGLPDDDDEPAPSSTAAAPSTMQLDSTQASSSQAPGPTQAPATPSNPSLKDLMNPAPDAAGPVGETQDTVMA